jgi:hypothetical protein
MSPKLALIAATLALGGAVGISAASAQDAATPPQPPKQEHPAPLRSTIFFNLVDRNADGAVDQEELAVLQKAIFAAIDADKDGKLTQDEFRKVADGARERMGRMGPGRMGPGFGPGRFHPGMDGRGGPDGRPGYDRGPRDNRQGAIEEQGFEGAPQPRDFASLDTNNDGVVSAEEFALGSPALGMPLTR